MGTCCPCDHGRAQHTKWGAGGGLDPPARVLDTTHTAKNRSLSEVCPSSVFTLATGEPENTTFGISTSAGDHLSRPLNQTLSLHPPSSAKGQHAKKLITRRSTSSLPRTARACRSLRPLVSPLAEGLAHKRPPHEAAHPPRRPRYATALRRGLRRLLRGGGEVLDELAQE